MPLSRLLALAILLLAGLAGPVDARRRFDPDQASASQPGDFDYYLLSLSLAPSFCALAPGNAAKDECRLLTAGAFQETPLTIHGLWPNRARVSTNRQPHDCDGPEFAVSDATRAELQRAMPAGPGLARYEWRKHGACSGLAPDAYFSTEVRLDRLANAAIGRPLLAQGGTVRIDDLLRAVAADNPALAAAIVVDCRFPRGGGDALIEEVRITLSRDLQPIPAASVGLGQNSGCPDGVGHVPGIGPSR